MKTYKINFKENNNIKLILLIFIIICLFILFFLIKYLINQNKYDNNNELKENFDLVQWKNKLINNLTNAVATKLKIPNESIKTEDCDSKCDASDCKIMRQMKKNLQECVKCHENPKKCFRRSIIGGNCDDCLKDEKQIDCSSTKEFGCTPPHNVFSYDGSLPYFIEIPDDNLNSPYDKKCVFCWQISDYI